MSSMSNLVASGESSDRTPNQLASTDAEASAIVAEPRKPKSARIRDQQVVLDLEGALPLWADEHFGATSIEDLAEAGYRKFACSVERKLRGIGAVRVLDRPAMDWLWVRTVTNLWHKREAEEGAADSDPTEINLLFLEREDGDGVENYWQKKASKNKTIFIKILYPIVGHNGLFESLDDLWDGYTIDDDIRCLLETKKEKGGNRWAVEEEPATAASDLPAPLRPLLLPFRLPLRLHSAPTQPPPAPAPVPAPAVAPAPVPASVPASVPAPASAPALSPATNGPRPPLALPQPSISFTLPVGRKRARSRSHGTAQEQPARKVSKTSASTAGVSAGEAERSE